MKQTIAKETFYMICKFFNLLLIASSWSFINLLRIKARFTSLSVFRISYICILLEFIHHILLYLIMFNRPNSNSYQSFFIYHWNLNSISARNFLKLSLSRAYITVHKFDVMFLRDLSRFIHFT